MSEDIGRRKIVDGVTDFISGSLGLFLNSLCNHKIRNQLSAIKYMLMKNTSTH